MYPTLVLIFSIVSALGLGRLAYLIFVDIRKALPFMFGGVEDSVAYQVAILASCMSATIAASIYAMFDGANPAWTIIITPFFFVWVSEFVLTGHRLFGPVLENFVVRWHPVDWFYAVTKTALELMWKNKGSVPLSALTASFNRGNKATDGADAERTADGAPEPAAATSVQNDGSHHLGAAAALEEGRPRNDVG